MDHNDFLRGPHVARGLGTTGVNVLINRIRGAQ
jgi:hypothetical protein